MIYCPECGSEVAPNDVFCPYCGIALVIAAPEVATETAQTENVPSVESELAAKPSDVVENINLEQNVTATSEKVSSDPIPATPLVLADDFELLIAPLTEMQEEVSTPIQEPVIEAKSEPVIEETPESVVEEVSAPGIEEVSVPVVEEEISAESPIVSAPRDGIVDIPVVSETESIKEPISELVEENLSPEEENEVLPEIVEETPIETEIKTEPAENQAENLPESVSETADTLRKVEVSEIVDALEKAEVDEFSATLPYIQSDFAKNKLDLGEFTLKKPDEKPLIEESAESAKAEVEAISSPVITTSVVEPLVVAEVSIPVEEIPIEEKAEVVAEVSSPVEAQVSVAESSGEDKDARSFTNPNFAVGIDTDGRNKAKLKPLEEGTVLNGRYEIVRKIGGGGMGAVYLANDKNLGGVLRAVKEMVQSYIEEAQQDKAVADFKRESLLLTSLEHSAIPTIYDYFYDEKEARFYLVMKYISGGDLAGRMRAAPEGRIDEVSITDWAIQIADVLDYLHRHEPPIVYRDLKPSNIMIDGNSGKVMLIDFGIARWVNKEEKGVTAVGTMGYAPPELFSGNVEPRSDIYSLGSTMFHLLTGADPQSNPLLIFDFNKNPRPRQINSQLSDQIEQILMRSVEYSSQQRFSSAAEMRDALSKHLENLRKGTVTFGVMTATSGMPMTGSLPVFCGFCGQKIVATDMFCPFCGAQQPLADQAKHLHTPSVYPAPKLTARLMIIGTNDLDQTEYNLEKENNLLGRRDPMSNIFPEVDLSKYDPQTKISRKHARIWRENDIFMLEDLGSSNGTILMSTANESNRLLPRQPHVLAHGDKIRVGDTTLRFTIG